MPTLPEFLEETPRASYWRMGPERYRAFPPGTSVSDAKARDNGSGYGNLNALKRLKGGA